MAGIFNASIFNNAIFNTAEVAPPAAAERNAGGYGAFWAGHVKTKKERQEAIERIEAQIRGPQKQAIAEAIVKVAEMPREDYAEALAVELESQALKYKKLYGRLLREEVRRKAREDDDEVAILMLMH
jgi:hypothetical protein